ncbi:hypothetical protein OHB12_31230 [Nocardia sp. NBC_01730]|nr:hypothetical protein OHB12_31230 [Nocardia sp. NBC_01730]
MSPPVVASLVMPVRRLAARPESLKTSLGVAIARAVALADHAGISRIR